MKFNKKVFDNGLILLHEKRDVPVTTMTVAVKYGSGHDSIKEKGMAHFIEHLCLKGTEKRTAREISYSLEKVGGYLNAFTSDEQTAYFVKLPSQHIRTAIDVLFDVFFNASFPEEEIKKEAGVVCEEINMYKDHPMRHVLDKLREHLYDKPFGMSALGKADVIKKMTRQQLIDKHREIYVPSNTIVSVVGNNDFEEVVKLVEEFCVNREGRKVDKIHLKKMNKQGEERRENLQQANVALGFHFPTACCEGRYAAEIFSSILGEGMSSRLFEEVREKRGLAYVIKSELDIGKDYGYLLVYIGTDAGKVDEAIDICLQEFKKMSHLTEQELEEGKEKVIGNHEVHSEASDEASMSLIFEEIVGNADNFYKYKEEINKVKMEDIRKLAEHAEYASFVLKP
ncbi:MAG: M16 family metallopeptidase [Candidatus Nanoarchaeia archaeon]